ncbi:hypothetical protein Micbo1qcDRAFT_177129 [Microdochium bolleyi]|uniref:Uncharacterized protein n=1 Tax=Microdochium bolleyi TaxID=196109 RepID=A0A136IW76_9PEZI|nr:hypothetical protein Micbo1qcDRAFT_177129 [Microdochium bolleyi]
MKVTKTGLVFAPSNTKKRKNANVADDAAGGEAPILEGWFLSAPGQKNTLVDVDYQQRYVRPDLRIHTLHDFDELANLLDKCIDRRDKEDGTHCKQLLKLVRANVEDIVETEELAKKGDDLDIRDQAVVASSECWRILHEDFAYEGVKGAMKEWTARSSSSKNTAKRFNDLFVVETMGKPGKPGKVKWVLEKPWGGKMILDEKQEVSIPLLTAAIKLQRIRLDIPKLLKDK